MESMPSRIEVFSGETFHQVCCECSLTHQVTVEVVGSLVRLRWLVDDEKTAEMKKLYSREGSRSQES